MKDSNDMPHSNSDPSDADLHQLFKGAGRRDAPPAEMRERTHAKTLAFWTEQMEIAQVSEPGWQTGRVAALAASILVAGFVGLLIFFQLRAPDNPPAGTILFASGGYHIRGDDVGVGQVANGALVSTSTSGRLEIRLSAANLLRLDKSSSVTIHNSEELWLHDGRIYVDASGSSHGVRVVTKQASIVDIGTQFEISVNGDELIVAVREGSVDVTLLDDKNFPVSAVKGLGEIVLLEGTNVVNRWELLSTDPHWSWIHSATAPFTAIDPPTHQFLTWATREIGLQLVYKTPIVQQVSRKERLKINGPISTPSVQSIREILSTTNLEVVEQHNNQLVIDFVR